MKIHNDKKIRDRFEKYTMPIPESGCLLWIGSVDNNGYGHLGIDGKIIRAHRISWEMNYGKIPKGMCICHKCDIPSCVNPNHLFTGSQIDNIKDRTAKNRSARNHGENSGMSKLTEKEVLRIRSDPRALKYISREFGIATSTASRVKRGITWGHI